MGLPKILIFTPVYEAKDYCFEEFIENTKNFTYPNFEHIIIDNSKTNNYATKLRRRGIKKVYHVDRGNNSREALARAQTFARQYAIENGYDYLFSLESDIFPPKDVLQRLLAHTTNVITGLYLIGNDSEGKPFVPCITLPKYEPSIKAFGTRLLYKEEIDYYTFNGLHQVQAGGMGCCLIHKSVFEKIGFYYDPRFNGHSDIYFFNKLFNRKIPVFVDTDLYCEHKNSDWRNCGDR